MIHQYIRRLSYFNSYLRLFSCLSEEKVLEGVMESIFTDHFENQFKSLSDVLVQEKIWTCDDVFKDSPLKSIVSLLNDKKSSLRPAQIGRGDEKSLKLEIRSDSMLWLSNEDSGFKDLWSLLDRLLEKFRGELFMPVKRYEAQVALYKKGDFYKRHVDRHKNSQERLITMVLYFNDWKDGDGGEFVLYKPETQEIKIEPKLNRMVLFFSELEHEVLPANKERKSLAIWFRSDIL